MRRRTVLLVAGAVAALAVAALVVGGGVIAATLPRGLGDGVVARVDGHPVTVAELRGYAAAHSLDLGTGDGRDAAVAGAVRVEALQAAALARGLVASDDLLAGLDAANAANAAAIDAGQAVYGVSRYSADTFYARAESTLEHDLAAALIADGDLSPTEAELRALYEETKDEVAREPDSLALRLLRFDTDSAGQAGVAEVFARLDAGEDFDAVAADYAARGGAGLVDVSSLDITPDTAYSIAKYESTLWAAVSDLQPGDTRLVTDDPGGGLLVVHCATRTPGGVQDLEEVRPDLTARYEEREFQRYADGLVRDADVVVTDRLDELLQH